MRNLRSTLLQYTNIFAFSSRWFAMLEEIPSSFIDTDPFTRHCHVHPCLWKHVIGILHMYLLDQQEVFILYLICEDLNKCHQIKRIALQYRQEGYNIFRQTSLENLPFFVMTISRRR